MRRSDKTTMVLALLAAIHASCGSSETSAPVTPTAPTPPPATVSGLTVTRLPSPIVVGSRVQVQATARLSDGTAQTLTPQWSVTPPNTITPDGMVTVTSVGSTSVVATYQGLSANSSFTTVPDYSGTWRGGWRRLECFGPRCSEGDRANPIVELLIGQHMGTVAQLSAVMLFGPWNDSREILTGRGNVGIAPTTALFVFAIERGPNGERVRENQVELTAVAIDAAQTLSARGSMLLREGSETTRLEFTLDRLGLVSRTVTAGTGDR